MRRRAPRLYSGRVPARADGGAGRARRELNSATASSSPPRTHSRTGPGGQEVLEILRRDGRGSSLHTRPINIIRRGRSFDIRRVSKKAGVNISLGTDTYPRDLILQMRWASYVGKVIARRDFTAATAGEVFKAATLRRRPRAGGRHGRLAPGAKADVIVVALRAATTACATA